MRRHKEILLDPIRRGTTPTNIFCIPYPPDILVGGFITYSQRGEAIFEKKFSDDCVTYEEGHLYVDLTQEETLLMTTADFCRAQIRFVLPDGKTASSGIYKIPVLGTLKGGEIR